MAVPTAPLAVTYAVTVFGRDFTGRSVSMEFLVRRQPGITDAKWWATTQPQVRGWKIAEVECEVRSAS